ncbi:uncharacterized protein LOC115797606 [Archocentrus centrarchus]|uniref:uncharacterized protein LOC115797606 n=1 Tax=Archocentrus centrarchus TaxID=63155 RepID=UPI0011EA43E2|nr:uncharacterized protein LOC115797606 [Archocentrus centrarchus]
MVNFRLMALLLCTFSWISSSVTQFYAVEVQPGEEVTLQCSNFSNFPGHIYWFKMTNSPNTSHIAALFSADANASFNDGFQDSKFSMTSNISVVFLKIKQLDSSDSGLHFCGEYNNGKPVISTGTYLKVQENPDRKLILRVLLGVGAVVLIAVVTAMTVKICRLQTGGNQEQNPHCSESLRDDSGQYLTGDRKQHNSPPAATLGQEFPVHWICSFSQIVLNRGCSISTVAAGSALSASAGMPSGPVAFPFFQHLMALMMSTFVGNLVFTLSCPEAGGISGVDSGGSLGSPQRAPPSVLSVLAHM